MKAFIQRVSKGVVSVRENNYWQEITKGLVILLGVKHGDTEKDSDLLAEKCVNLRIFEDAEGKMNLSVKDIGGEILSVSQFTLYADTKKGNRPGFSEAANPEIANNLYNKFNHKLKTILGNNNIKTGIFAADMELEIHNMGPVTILLESIEGKIIS